jgi:hypothetical protein
VPRVVQDGASLLLIESRGVRQHLLRTGDATFQDLRNAGVIDELVYISSS